MIDPPPPLFDLIKWTFFLVAFVFALYGLITLVIIAVCAWNMQASLAAGQECIEKGGVTQALSTMLASALAFAAGRVSKKD